MGQGLGDPLEEAPREGHRARGRVEGRLASTIGAVCSPAALPRKLCRQLLGIKVKTQPVEGSLCRDGRCGKGVERLMDLGGLETEAQQLLQTIKDHA